MLSRAYHFDLDDLSGTRKRGKDVEPEDSTNVVSPCKKTCVSEEEDDRSSMLNEILSSLAAPCACTIAEEKKAASVALLPRESKDAKISLPVDESSTRMLTTHCAFPIALTDPEEHVSHAFSCMPLMRPMAHDLDMASSDMRKNAAIVLVIVNLIH